MVDLGNVLTAMVTPFNADLEVDYDNLSEYIERQKSVFSPTDPSLAPAIEREAARARNTRPDDAVVPSGVQEGDELLA